MSEDQFTPRFDHDWQREAWERERAEMRERIARDRRDETHGADVDVKALLGSVKPTIVPDEPRACPLPRHPAQPSAGDTCDTEMHYGWNDRFACWESFERCPERRRSEVIGTVAAERNRLAGELEQMAKLGPVGFEGYDKMHGKGCEAAWVAAREFAAGRPPARNVFLTGPTGLGKTRLLIASHLGLLAAGVRSMYVTTPDLRAAFERQAARSKSFDEEERGRPEELLDRLRRTAAVHLDDVGNVDDDERKAGPFREGLKHLLDSSRAAWMTACNLTLEKAKEHPDVGPKILSRLMTGAVFVKLEGTDYRIDHAERRK